MKVSKGFNHLLKSPFCVHPSTGRVCVPIDPTDCENFDFTKVPTLNELIKELNSGKQINSLTPYIKKNLKKKKTF